MAQITTGNVVVRRRKDGILLVYVDGVLMQGITAVRLDSDYNDDRTARLHVEILGRFVRLETEE